MKQRSVDLAILGGGCAGLSLARELSLNSNWQRKAVVIEPRTTYHNDRSWCFWESLDLSLQKSLEPLIQHSWQQWRFSGGTFSEVHTANGRRYCFIAGEDFYAEALSVIDAKQHIELMLGQTVTATRSDTQGFLITLADGSSVHAQQIIDTRLSVYSHSEQAKMWQIFYGYEIETTDNIFDESTVGLMENLTGQTSATQFLYLLPFSKKHALIELTQFSNQLFTPEKLDPALNHYLQTTIGIGHFKILRREQGCLPMGLKAVARTKLPNYHYAGTVAGAIRPATGYAFIGIQQWARHCAASLCQGGSVTPVKRSTSLVKAMDQVFLSVLQDTPALGAALFQALAQRVSGPALVRFLMDEAKIKDYYQIIKALPALRFISYSLGLNFLFYPR